MNALLYITVPILIVLLITVIYLFIKLNYNKGQVSQNIEGLIQILKEDMTRNAFEHKQELQNQLNQVNEQMNTGIRHSHSSMQKQFEHTSKIVQDVTERLTSLDKTNKQVLDFSGQLQDLQNILKNPKQRGVLGEYWLENLLSNVLPKDSYKMQYAVGEDSSGQKLIADAAIFIRDQIIPIDAKFSLENYNRMVCADNEEIKLRLERDFKADVKRRIDETSKYIRPEFNTMNFAFMFIPAEGVYYNLLNAEVGSGINSNNLVEYAFAKHVMLVSPTSFYAYLQTVLMGLRELQLEKSTQEIIKRVGELGKHVKGYSEYHDKLGKNLSTVVNQYNQSGNELKKVSKDVKKITSGDMDIVIEAEDVERPRIA